MATGPSRLDGLNSGEATFAAKQPLRRGFWKTIWMVIRPPPILCHRRLWVSLGLNLFVIRFCWTENLKTYHQGDRDWSSGGHDTTLAPPSPSPAELICKKSKQSHLLLRFFFIPLSGNDHHYLHRISKGE